MDFVIAYGFDKINRIAAADLMRGDIKVKIIERINRVIMVLRRGLITVDEAAQAIAQAEQAI